MRFPLGFYDISLWLAVAAIILLATSEYHSLHNGQTSLIIEKRRLRTVALTLGARCSRLTDPLESSYDTTSTDINHTTRAKVKHLYIL